MGALGYQFLCNQLQLTAFSPLREEDYLAALQSYSIPMQLQWDVRWIGDEEYDFRFKRDESLYRYWGATQVVEFSLDMARQALEKDFREETEFLNRFDQVYLAIDE